jgi:hypothetical protein
VRCSLAAQGIPQQTGYPHLAQSTLDIAQSSPVSAAKIIEPQGTKIKRCQFAGAIPKSLTKNTKCAHSPSTMVHPPQISQTTIQQAV